MYVFYHEKIYIFLLQHKHYKYVDLTLISK